MRDRGLGLALFLLGPARQARKIKITSLLLHLGCYAWNKHSDHVYIKFEASAEATHLQWKSAEVACKGIEIEQREVKRSGCRKRHTHFTQFQGGLVGTMCVYSAYQFLSAHTAIE